MHTISLRVGALLGLSVLSLAGCGAAGASSDSLDNGIGFAGYGGSGASSGAGGASGVGGASGFGDSGGASGTGVISPTAGSGGSVVPSGGSGGAGAGGAGGSGGASGMGGAGGTGGAGGAGAAGGSGGTGGMGGAGGTGGAGMGGAGGMVVSGGACCDDGNCLCHGDPPSMLSTNDGPYDVDTLELTTGTVYYPTDAEPPLAGIAICPGFLNSGPEMAAWGPFYASHGIVLIAAYTLGSDIPEIRAIKLLDAVKELDAENTKSGSPLNGKLAGWYGTSGYSMGGGGTTIATVSDKTLRTSIGLAAWGPVGTGITTPTLFLCGESDTVAPCFGSQDAYNAIPGETPKMIISIPGATHFSWFGPEDAGGGTSGAYALAFQKVFLEGDERWRDLLLRAPSGCTQTTNITP